MPTRSPSIESLTGVNWRWPGFGTLQGVHFTGNAMKTLLAIVALLVVSALFISEVAAAFLRT